MQQSIRYLKTSDDVRLAWATSGKGPALVKASNWLTHLSYDLESPIWRHWIEFFSTHFRFIRYDERGCGMTDWDAEDLSTPRETDDLEAVIDASGPGEQFVLLGVSQGTAPAVSYAVRHPERVSRLILYGGYATGWLHREDSRGAATLSRHDRAGPRSAGVKTTRCSVSSSPRYSCRTRDRSRSSGSTSSAAARRLPRSRHGSLTLARGDRRARFAAAGSRTDARPARAQR